MEVESTSADIVLTGSVVSISWRQLWSEWNETAVYLSLGPIICVCVCVSAYALQWEVCVCFCVYSLGYVSEMYINIQDLCVKYYLCFVCFVCVYLDLSLCVGAFSVTPALLLGHLMVTWRPSFALHGCVYVHVCVSGCSQCVCLCV